MLNRVRIAITFSQREQAALNKRFPTVASFKRELASLERELKKKFPGKIASVETIVRKKRA